MRVSAGDIRIDSGSSYSFTAWNTDYSTVTISTANSSNPRIDRIVAYIDLFTTPQTANPNNPGMLKFLAVAGTPAGSPSAPSDGDVTTAVNADAGAASPWCELARVDVAASVTTISSGNITDYRSMLGLSFIPLLRDTHTYTASDTWTKPTGMGTNGYIVVEVVGGGGGSGGCAATSSGQVAEAGGGGGGGYARKKISSASLSSTETVTVGEGGTAGASGQNTGGTGGTSSFGAHCSAAGGNPGIGSAASSGSINSGGGSGGIATGGDINVRGGSGGSGRAVGAETFRTNLGGGSMYAGMSKVGNAGSEVALDGYLYGGGAAGSRSSQSLSAKTGAVGADGLVIVYEYY